ncbi:hypothetical protein PMAYCL1PPCAC_22975, partial [Pristionchus mayeri]
AGLVTEASGAAALPSDPKMMVIDGEGLKLLPWDKVAEMLGAAFVLFFQFFIIVGGAIPYVFQYSEIHHRRNASGFSLFVCLALCVANILRILFWFGKRFDTALLAQSCVMLTAMVLMLEIAVRMNRKHTPKSQRRSLLKGHLRPGFWAWHDLQSFLLALLIFTVFWGIVTAILTPYSWYVELLGMVSLLVEATLGMPQLIRNCQRKSTTGMSIPMVLAWLVGDLSKTGYFVATGSPLQFWVCAIIQISIDIFILGQVIVFRGREGSAASANGSLPYTADDNTPPHLDID